MKEGSEAYKELQKIVFDTRLTTDLRYLTEFSHTGSLEVFHSLLNKYCPKSLHFDYEGMVARCQLAAIDHNHGVDLPQATTKANKLRWKSVFPKHNSQWVKKIIKHKKTKNYIESMKDEVIRCANEDIEPTRIEKPDLPKNIAHIPKPPSSEILHVSRFHPKQT